jgi:cation transporter-like permease
MTWWRTGVSAIIGFLVAPLTPVAGYHLARWTGSESVFDVSLVLMFALALPSMLLLSRKLWVGLLLAALATPALLYLAFCYGVTYGCRLNLGSCL